MNDVSRAGLVGRTLAHYRINTALGAGGMGEVYRATDTRLGRDVALKVLPPEMAGDPDRLARFQREARAVAALNHPNVVTVYSVEEWDGVHFITMELIEGQPLDRLISANGLPADRIIEIAGAIAEALAAAHEKGIVHRDLKPANVMVTDEGRTKVLDFGLAKDVGAETANDDTLTSAGRTQAGMVMGTPAYMSPEQVSGRPLDHRSDIFALGVVLHEMATGRRPFGGSSSAELISSILRDTPPSVTDLRSELPADLARVIRRCLDKDPRYRMQTARDVSNEFRDLARTTTHPGPVLTSAARTPVPADSGAARADESFWVAVLPFKYTGTNADLSGLAEGLSEEVVTGLSRFSYLRVIARSSTARYSGQSVDVRNAGNELNARYVMEGTLRQAGGKLRLAVQLVDTVSGAHLWAENYERVFSAEAVFELQDDLVPRIVSTVADMNGVLPQSMSEGLRSRPPEQLSPYEAVLRSFAYCSAARPEELSAARSGLEEAVRKAPAYSDAWAMLSFLCGQDHVHGYELQPNALEIAASAAQRAVALGPSNHLAYFSLAAVLWYQKDFDSFRDAAERAVALNPMDGNSVAFLGELMTYAGSVERGMQLAERAKQLNPNHPGWYWYADFYHAFSQRDYRLALAFALKVKMRGNPLAPMMIAAACGQLGDVEGGARAVSDLLKFRPELPAIMCKQVAKVWNPEYGARFLDGLRKAGVVISDVQTTSLKESTSASQPMKTRDSGISRAEEGFWIAVLPFKHTGGGQDLKVLSEGLSEEVITGLSRFSYLRVIARGSTAKYSSESGDVRAIGRELGARYVMEGSLRLAGSKVRLAVQLVDTVSGTHLWAETYERVFQPESVFELQDELVPRIVSTVADRHGVLPHSMSEAVRAKDLGQLTPYEAVLLSFSYAERITSDEQIAAKASLEHAVVQVPGYADAWAMLAMLFCDEYGLGFTLESSLLERGLEAARRAVKAGPSNHLAYQNLAYAHFLRREHGPCRNAVERSLALNSMDGSNVWFMGLVLAYMGDWERGCALIERAMQLNPHFPGKYRYPLVANAYRKGDYMGALDEALRINMPDVFYTPLLMTAAHGQLGQRKAAEKTLRDLLVLKPDTAAIARESLGKWFQPELVEHFIEGLAKAGLDVGGVGASSAPKPAVTGSGKSRADEGFWIAVLPFKSVGSGTDLAALADGLTEDILTNLSKFSYLRVIARGSTEQYAERAVDLRRAARELGARYVMEGSIRQAGAKVRIAVQLVDASTGASLWAETYDRAFNAEATLDLLDDVVPRIVATVGDAQGILAHSMTEVLRNRNPESLSPYEALLRSFGFHQHVSAEEHLAGRTALERAVEQAPDRADCWAMLSWLYRAEYTHGYNSRPDPMERSLAAARRAVNLAPSSQLAQAALASAFFFRKEFGAFRSAAERALALNHMQGYTTAFLGMHFAFSGDWERGCALCEGATQLNPNHPGWYWLALAVNAYRQREGKLALEYVLRINMPALWTAQVTLAVVHAQLGQMEQARIAVRDLLALRPDFAATAREELGKWWLPEMVEQMLGDLRTAGLETPGAAAIPARSFGTTQARTMEGQKQSASGPVPFAQSIAVLPFSNMSDDKEQDYFSDGLAEEILNLLAQIPGLKVIARTSAFAFRGKEQDIRGIAEALGVNTVLEGSVRRAGGRIRVTAQLIHAADGSHLWSERYDRELSDIFAVQDEISAAIARALRVKLARDGAPQRYTPKLEAYEAYLKGRYHQAKVTPESMELARRFYQQASELDPAFAMPHVGLAFYWHCLAHFGRHFARDCVSPARAEARQALQIDPSLPEAHAFLGYIAAMYDLDWAAADLHFDSPGAKEVGFGLLRPLYAWVQFWQGNVEPAIKLAERAIEEDPLEVWTRMNLHAYLQAAGRIDETLEQLKKVLELDENLVLAQVSMAMIQADRGNMAEALRIARRAYAIGPWSPDPIGVLAGLTRRNGDEVEAPLMKALGSGEVPGDARAHALFHLLCGEIEQGADWAEKAIEQRDASMMVYLRFAVCKGLRASHRWPKIAKMINLPVKA